MIGDLKVELCRLYENTSARSGKTYFVGYLGKAKVLMLKDEKAADGEPPWRMFITERPEKRADGGQVLPPASKPPPAKPASRTRRAPSKRHAMHDRPFDDSLDDVAMFL